MFSPYMIMYTFDTRYFRSQKLPYSDCLITDAPPHSTLAGLVARLDACPTGIREVAGLIFWFGNILLWRFSRSQGHLECQTLTSRKLLCIKVTPDLQLVYSKNGGNLELVLKMKSISILLTKHVKYTYLYLFKFVLFSIVAFKVN